MDWLIEPFSQPFMQRVLLGGALAVVTSALVGTWVVLRGLSFMGDALAHGVTPGIALAFAIGFDLTIGAVLAAIVMVAGITLVGRLPEMLQRIDAVGSDLTFDGFGWDESVNAPSLRLTQMTVSGT